MILICDYRVHSAQTFQCPDFTHRRLILAVVQNSDPFRVLGPMTAQSHHLSVVSTFPGVWEKQRVAREETGMLSVQQPPYL